MSKHYSAIFALGLAGAALGCSSSDGGSNANGGSNAASGGSGAAHGGATAANGGAVGSGGGNASGGMSTTQAGSSSANGGSANGGAATNGGSANGGTSSAGAGTTAGASTTAGAGGSTPGISSCPAPPAGATDNAIKALNAINTLRLAMGVECGNLVLALDQSAQAHCDFYAANTGNATCEGGSISPHSEVSGCTGFTGADPGARVAAAGYKGNGWSEVMAFNDDPNKAVTQWVDSVWHRTPLLSPWWDDMGYGNAGTSRATNCDVIDQGPGKQMPATTTAMYPYAGQTGVTRSFNGAQEGPVPPAPPTGWPSGLPITLYVQKAITVSHSIEVMGSGTPLDHQWIDYKQSDNDSDQLIMYTNAPFAANTTYHVTIAVTLAGAPKTFDWTFTTGS
jgi:hypothetical protein